MGKARCMGLLHGIAKVSSVLLKTGLTAGGIAMWAVAPRSRFIRAMQGANDVPGSYFAHRGLHDSGSGIEEDWSKAGRDKREYLSVSRQLAAGSVDVSFLRVNSDAETQDLAATQSRNSPISVTPENSLPAFAAACRVGYGIELDLHLTRDGQVVVIHDDDLQRVAGDARQVSDLTYAELSRIPLNSDKRSPDKEILDGHEIMPVRVGKHARRVSRSQVAPIHVPLLSDVLYMINGSVPVIIEYKMGRTFNRSLVEKADALLSAYKGAYAVESFNPLVLAWYRRYRRSVCRGQLASHYDGEVGSKKQLFQAMASSLLFNWVGRPDFVAYEWHAGSVFPLRLFRALGGTPVAWTVPSRQAEREASSGFDRFIFEGYLPPVLY